MQRRLALAFALTALSAVILVGLGTMMLAQQGARREATGKLAAEMEAISALASGTQSLGEFGPALVRSKQAFDFSSLEVVVVTGDGRLTVPDKARLGRKRTRLLPASETDLEIPSQLSEQQRIDFDDNRVVTFDIDRQVLALSRLDIRLRDASAGQASFALLGSRPVAALPRQAVGWFLLSGGTVVLGATAAGIWLARRIVRPIRSLQQTTAALAAGNLDARTAIDTGDELADLGRSVDQMAGELQRSQQLDQQFLMSISHDLRTPLTAIEGYGEALADGTADNPPEVGRIVVNQARRLERLVQDLMDLARLDANQFTFDVRTVDMAVLAGRAVAAMQSTYDNVLVTFSRESADPLLVRGDADRLTQVMTNLIDNGCKFARTSVSVSTRRDGPWVVATVNDDGPGISDVDIPHVFERLYTGTAQPARAENPAGLGLAIVKELVTGMNGTVHAGRSHDGGTRILVRLPVVEG